MRQLCLHRIDFDGWEDWFTVILVDYILMLRVLALYGHDKVLSLFLKAILALEGALRLGTLIYLNIFQKVTLGSFAQNIYVCLVDGYVPWQLELVDWIVPVAYGLLLMILAIYKATDYWKLTAGLQGLALVKVLILDQFIYFLLAVACCTFNVIETRIKIPNAYLAAVIGDLGSPSLLCLLGSRLLVHLKEAAEQGHNEGTSYRMRSELTSDIEFA
ncbi:uncharacterized protein FOMMEDRAFT_161261 [Fomitiporia mediterranea MF3/22]|uniref:uncharacterized protein n=1 Tax=Fomitiporia mediterranea (strain MF3/22) TaxID=694068 RepID=UPI00044097F5|nr:uncharacterized protein FOMMEDRAFT_161261 [Fomitiporia mediterranea MF3/22]EJC99041.1 hypothetical protein FOMMEDRAFT_161261 [Fomitiporia mediterranea MF3/22]